MNPKLWKQKARKNIRKNYGRCFAVCFIVTLLIGGTIITTIRDTKSTHIPTTLNAIENKSNSDIVNEFVNGVVPDYTFQDKNGVIGNILNNVSESGSLIFGVLNAMNQFFFQDHLLAGFIIVLGVLIGIFYRIFIASVIEVGSCRFFLENRLYSKTRIGRIILPYRVRKSMKVSFAMLRKNIYQILWMFTIVGGVIKFYSYRMVSYILAENPDLSGQEAISLSCNMMKGHKFEAFLLDVSMIPYFILGLVTLNLFNLFYTNLYYKAVYAEFYMYLRHVYSDYSFPDVYLEQNKNHLKHYPEEKYFLKQHESRNILKRLQFNQNYDLQSYILFFFSFSLLGWIWEVCFTLFSSGVFVNRGVYYGPWLPIYGSGGVLILFLLRRLRNRPWLTFLLTMLICGILEYGTAFYLETFKGLKWWDYTGFFLNIQGRVCLEGLLFFGIGGLAFIYVLAPYFSSIFSKWNVTLKKCLCIFLVILFSIDFVYSSKYPNQGNQITSPVVQEK